MVPPLPFSMGLMPPAKLHLATIVLRLVRSISACAKGQLGVMELVNGGSMTLALKALVQRLVLKTLELSSLRHLVGLHTISLRPTLQQTRSRHLPINRYCGGVPAQRVSRMQPPTVQSRWARHLKPAMWVQWMPPTRSSVAQGLKQERPPTQ